MLPHLPAMKSLHRTPIIFFASAFAAFVTADLAAQNTTTLGTIEGRVVSARNGEYLENARVSVEGTSLETFTDAEGSYRLANVPAGAVRVRAFFTGMTPQTIDVSVMPGQSVNRDITLTPLSFDRDGTVKLSQFVVAEAREMDAAALAINEQRFAPNIKNVVSTEEFGN